MILKQEIGGEGVEYARRMKYGRAIEKNRLYGNIGGCGFLVCVFVFSISLKMSVWVNSVENKHQFCD